MNRIPKAVYTKEFREEALKLAMTGAAGVPAAGSVRERLLRVAQALAVVAGTAGAGTGGRSARGASAHR